jgi:DNA-binding NtrC family response regulator
VKPAEYSILVLEDEPAILHLVTAMLESAGITGARTSSSIAEARRNWRTHAGKFDLFVTDFSLPDGSACEFINELLAEKPELPVLLMSGFSEDMMDIGQISGRVTLLQKPFRPSELRATILRLIDLSKCCQTATEK